MPDAATESWMAAQAVDSHDVAALSETQAHERCGEARLVGRAARPDDVAAFVRAHPSQSEALGEAHLALAGKPVPAHA